MTKTQVKYNKPIYVGFTVLELSKWCMYNFVYDYLKPKFGDRVKILQTDTDGLMIEILSDDFYDEIRDDIKDVFDTSNFSTNNKYKLPILNSLIPGLFKIESGESHVTEFVG